MIEKWHDEVLGDFIALARHSRLPYIVQDEYGNLMAKVVPFGPHADLYACFYPNRVDLRLKNGKSLGTFQYAKESREGLPDAVCVSDEELKNGYSAFFDTLIEAYDSHHSKACEIWEGLLDVWSEIMEALRAC